MLPVLEQAGVDAARLRSNLLTELERLPKLKQATGEISIGPELGRLLNLTDRLAQKHGDQFISSDWFLRAAVDDKGTLGKVLREAGARAELIEKAITSARGNATVD